MAAAASSRSRSASRCWPRWSTPAALTLRDLARRRRHDLGQGPPYLVSFTRVGLVQQDTVTGQYELGPFALQMGLVSLQRLDPVRVALPEVDKLQSEIGHTLGIAVLGSHGPTMIHITEASYPVHVNMRKGTVMSMLHTATGQVFAAWLPQRWPSTTSPAKTATPRSSPA